MKRQIKIEITLEMDEKYFDFSDKEESEWFYKTVIPSISAVHSEEIGDYIGDVVNVKVINENVQIWE